MQDAEILLGVAQLLLGEDVAVLQTEVVFLVEEALALNAGHVENVELGHDGFEVGRLLVGDVVLLERLVLHVAGKLELLGGDENDLDAGVAAQGADEGVDGAAELEVAAEADGQVIEAALFAVDGEKVGQRLGGVVVTAVARVDDGDLRVHGGDQRRALLGVTHGDDVSIAADSAHRVGNALALGGGRAACGREAQHLAAKTEHRGLKAQARAGRGLKEERCEDLAVALVCVGVGVVDDVVGRGDHIVDLLGGQLQNVDQMLHVSSFLRSKIHPTGCCETE